MTDDILRYTDLAAAIQLAKAAGMTTREIVRELTGGMTCSDALRFAKRAAPLLDITISEFMRLRKNDGNSRFFKPCQEPFAVTLFAELRIVHAALFFEHLLFDSSQQPTGGVVQQFSFTLSCPGIGDFHASMIGQNSPEFNPKF